MTRIITFTAVLAALLLGSGIARADSLFEDLGGPDRVRAFLDETIDRSATDPRTADTLKKSDLKRLKSRLYDQVCELTGGPCSYKGPNMKKAHIGLGLTTRHFNVMVEHLQEAMARQNVGNATQNRLLALLAPMHRDVVEK